MPENIPTQPQPLHPSWAVPPSHAESRREAFATMCMYGPNRMASAQDFAEHLNAICEIVAPEEPEHYEELMGEIEQSGIHKSVSRFVRRVQALNDAGKVVDPPGCRFEASWDVRNPHWKSEGLVLPNWLTFAISHPADLIHALCESESASAIWIWLFWYAHAGRSVPIAIASIPAPDIDFGAWTIDPCGEWHALNEPELAIEFFRQTTTAHRSEEPARELLGIPKKAGEKFAQHGPYLASDIEQLLVVYDQLARCCFEFAEF